MAAFLTGIDHAVIGVRDLDAAKITFEKLGFRLTPRGRHEGWGTANFCAMFDRDYIELLGLVDPAKFNNGLDAFLEQGEGMLSLALETANADDTRAEWAAAGLEPAEVKELSRLLEPDTTLRFKNVMLPPESSGGLPLFACAHLTRDAIRQPEWLDHPNGAIGIRTVTVATAEPGAFVEPMSRIFGEPRLTETDDTLAVHTGGAVLLFATPDDLDMLHPQLQVQSGDEQARLAVLSLGVRDLDATADWLEKAGVPFTRHASGIIGVSAEHARGVMLEFTL
jgi:catechol 2,3-dioxygenase-like lactoylglutathione lyase family enzyme